mmetsp:Transcript_7612/g.14396  ORF Transcript_7612/g.14396 Transcript_7612/m.14396 type:complete len:825 (+) Transcript_7612:52-2526(+)
MLGDDSKTGDDDNVYSVSIHPEHAFLALGGQSTVKIWSLQTASFVSLLSHTGQVHAVCFSDDGNHLASAGSSDDSFTIKIWKCECDGSSIAISLLSCDVDFGVEKLHQGQITGLRFGQLDDQRTPFCLASCSHDQTIRLWDIRVVCSSSADIAAYTKQMRNTNRVTLRQHRDKVMGMDFSDDSRFLATCGMDGSIIVWKLFVPADPLAPFQANQSAPYNLGRREPVLCVDFAPHYFELGYKREYVLCCGTNEALLLLHIKDDRIRDDPTSNFSTFFSRLRLGLPEPTGLKKRLGGCCCFDSRLYMSSVDPPLLAIESDDEEEDDNDADTHLNRQAFAKQERDKKKKEKEDMKARKEFAAYNNGVNYIQITLVNRIKQKGGVRSLCSGFHRFVQQADRLLVFKKRKLVEDLRAEQQKEAERREKKILRAIKRQVKKIEKQAASREALQSGVGISFKKTNKRKKKVPEAPTPLQLIEQREEAKKQKEAEAKRQAEKANAHAKLLKEAEDTVRSKYNKKRAGGLGTSSTLVNAELKLQELEQRVQVQCALYVNFTCLQQHEVRGVLFTGQTMQPYSHRTTNKVRKGGGGNKLYYTHQAVLGVHSAPIPSITLPTQELHSQLEKCGYVANGENLSVTVSDDHTVKLFKWGVASRELNTGFGGGKQKQSRRAAIKQLLAGSLDNTDVFSPMVLEIKTQVDSSRNVPNSAKQGLGGLGGGFGMPALPQPWIVIGEEATEQSEYAANVRHRAAQAQRDEGAAFSWPDPRVSEGVGVLSARDVAAARQGAKKPNTSARTGEEWGSDVEEEETGRNSQRTQQQQQQQLRQQPV